MAERKPDRSGGGDGERLWNPKNPNIAIERDADGVVRMVRHPRAPYFATWAQDDDVDGRGLARLAAGYLRAVNALVGLPDYLLADLARSNGDQAVDNQAPAPPGLPANRFTLAWAPLPVGTAPADDPRASFWIARRKAGRRAHARVLLDRSIVLLAPLVVLDGAQARPLYGGQGLRVTAHVTPNERGPATVRFTALTHTLPDPPKLLGLSADDKLLATLRAWYAQGWETRDAAIGRAFGVTDGARALETGIALRLDAAHPAGVLEVIALGAPALDQTGEPRTAGAAYVAWLGDDGRQLSPRRRRALVAHGALARVFAQDPPSRFGPAAAHTMRANRPSAALDAAMTWAVLPDTPSKQPFYVLLRDAAQRGAARINVVPSTLIQNDPARDGSKEIVFISATRARSNPTAAASAYHHAHQWFDRLERYGLDAATTLKFAELPVAVHYRAGLLHGPGRDGKTINAQVAWTPQWKPRTDGGVVTGTLSMRFALADLALSPAAQPLGLACDPRWGWHELCHVLLAGATGELEFAFAHSAGDALAAILCDPASRLAHATDKPAWRGVTFPWIDVPARRHDREAARGWNWGGSMYRREYFYSAVHACDKNGYWAEQILSTTLFNVYRAIGGDTVHANGAPDVASRGAAADYAAYLIMRAIVDLGPAAVTVATTVDHFVTALMNADSSVVRFDMGAGRPRPGGFAHKVVRWAFENQGLYQPAGSGLGNDGVGLPEPIDLFIDDGRTGRYTPIDYSAESWWATRAALALAPRAAGGREIVVQAANRGTSSAANASAAAWAVELGASESPPAWPDARWVSIGASAIGATIPSGGRVEVRIDWPGAQAGKRYAVLVALGSAEDPSNIDTATGLPCADPPAGVVSPIDLLVACDNNLGLRVFTI